MFSVRTAWTLEMNRLSSLLAEHRRTGRPLLDLTESNPTSCSLAYPAAEILESLADPAALAYEPDPCGIRSAREAVAGDYVGRGAAVGASDLVLTASTSEAYSFLFRVLADPGDRILVPAPSYPLFDLLARLNDVTGVDYPLRPDLDYAIDFDALGRAAAAGARAVLLVSPGNPTGAYLKQAERERLVQLCLEHGMALVCDEVFGDYPFGEDAARVATMAGEPRVLTFVLNGVSKMLALPQLKLAWIAASGPEPQKREAMRRLEMVADTFLSVGAPVQHALPRLLKLRGRLQAPVRGRVASNRAWLDTQLEGGRACASRRAEGGWSAVLDVPRTRSEEEWALRLLEADAVLVHPGYFFDFPGEGRLVVSLLPAEETFRTGVARLLKRVEAEA
ncbi:MAG TPA: pyridoxal phosphate-dependent aminotransferase [Candidatus Polarisedimenticolia bacterium]|nr:pyridoxal phosphate-dependent aminotransferase [Candidatus Polarisedimenticolia bacterium]